VISIRKIEREDLDQLFALDRICFRPGIAYSKAELNYFIRHPRTLSLAAVDETDSLAGFAMVELESGNGISIGHIVTIDVDPAQRRKGIGTVLMNAMIEGLSKLDADGVRLEVAVDNLEAQGFYQRHGFIETGRIPGFYMGTLDALTMQRPLSR
jgi:[ribosomal protein S18]-alanine N-acetyltransferase